MLLNALYWHVKTCHASCQLRNQEGCRGRNCFSVVMTRAMLLCELTWEHYIADSHEQNPLKFKKDFPRSKLKKHSLALFIRDIPLAEIGKHTWVIQHRLHCMEYCVNCMCTYKWYIYIYYGLLWHALVHIGIFNVISTSFTSMLQGQSAVGRCAARGASRNGKSLRRCATDRIRSVAQMGGGIFKICQ